MSCCLTRRGQVRQQPFFNPGPGTVGDLQRRMFNGPWALSFNGSVKKQFRLFERQTLDLHFDMFNLFNHPVFYLYPSTAGDYGFSASGFNNFNVNAATFGKLTSTTGGARVIQIGAYYRF